MKRHSVWRPDAKVNTAGVERRQLRKRPRTSVLGSATPARRADQADLAATVMLRPFLQKVEATRGTPPRPCSADSFERTRIVTTQTRRSHAAPGLFLCPRNATTIKDTLQAFRRQAHFLGTRPSRSGCPSDAITAPHQVPNHLDRMHPRAPLGAGGSFFARPGRRRSRAAAMRSRHAPDPGLQVGASGRPRPGLVGPGEPTCCA